MLSASTANGMALSFMMSFISTNNLKIDNMQDLTLVLKPTEDSKYPIGPTINVDEGLVTEYNYITYSNGVWKLASSDIELANVDFTVMVDTVTTL